MATFNVGQYLGKRKKGGASIYNTLHSQLSMMENQFAGDGNLSPGDFDVLISSARSIYANPGLSATDRNAVAVKISEYEKGKNVKRIQDFSDIQRINRDVKDSLRINSLNFANDPKALLETNTDALNAKATQLALIIDGMRETGGDVTPYADELTSTLNDYNDSQAALASVSAYANQSQPQSDFVAYITTNPKGEINDIQVGRIGSKTGYAETNGIYGGMQVYGKINRKEGSNNIFQLGATRFSAPDISLPDPDNPLGMKANPLMAQQTQQQQGAVTTGQGGTYHVIDPLTINPQRSVFVGGWASGNNGLYRKKENGMYEKHVNVTPEQLGISPNDILNIPDTFERSINDQVDMTIDGSQSTLPQSFIGQPSQWTVGMQAIQPQQTPTPALQQQPFIGPQQQPFIGPQQQPTGTSRTPSPTERAPQGAKAIAQNLIQGMRGFLG